MGRRNERGPGNELGARKAEQGVAENAGVENAGVENARVDRTDGKCRSGKYRSDNVWKAVKQKIIFFLNIFN